MRRPLAALALAAAVLAGPLVGISSAMERTPASATPGGASVRTVSPDTANRPIYNPMSWEVSSLRFPELPDAVTRVISQDDASLKFALGNELGGFRSAPKGGNAFLGRGQPIFGLAAPPVLPTRVLRPLGSGDSGDTVLGERPVVSQQTVIPHLDDTFDQSRSSFAFLGGPPALAPEPTGGTQAFPLVQSVLADKNPGVPDNIPTTPTTTPVTQPEQTTPRSTVPQPQTGTTLLTEPTTTTQAPTTTTAAPTTTTTQAPTTTTTQAPTTTTAAPTTTTTQAPTTTTTQAPTTTTTTTTTPPPTTTTTTPPTTPPITSTFVIGNTKDSNTTCFANGRGAPAGNTCDRLFDLSNIAPGHASVVNLTLWNVDPDSNVDGNDVSVYTSAPCTSGISGTTRNGGTGNLCSGLQMKIERYSDVGRTALVGCLYGCGSNKSLSQFSTAFGSQSSALHVDDALAVNARIFLKITLTLPNNGSNSTTGIGADNAFQGRTASLALNWRVTAP